MLVLRTTTLVLLLVLHGVAAAQAGEPLPSWNDGETKAAILKFVADVSNEDGEHFVPVSERIAVFDNDGTLWCEQPLYTQLMFALDRVKALAPQHPEWKTQEPFASALRGDQAGLAAQGEGALLKLLMGTHANLTTDEFANVVSAWIKEARHPRTGRLYTEMVYQPMLELLTFLRENDFKTFIVSGGGIEFMRPWADDVYGIPPEQVVGSSIKTEFKIVDGEPVIIRLPEINFVDDKAGKPVGIHQHIGRRPIAAFGNSDGDLQMLQWVGGREGRTLCLYVHHTDAKREWAYDRDSHIGRLDAGLDAAKAKGWVVVDMQQDWKQIFPPRSNAEHDSTSN